MGLAKKRGRGCAGVRGFPAAPFGAPRKGVTDLCGNQRPLWTSGPFLLESKTIRAGTGLRDGCSPIIG